MKYILDNNYQIALVQDDHEEGLTKTQLRDAIQYMVTDRYEQVKSKQAEKIKLNIAIEAIHKDICELKIIMNRVYDLD